MYNLRWWPKTFKYWLFFNTVYTWFKSWGFIVWWAKGLVKLSFNLNIFSKLQITCISISSFLRANFTLRSFLSHNIYYLLQMWRIEFYCIIVVKSILVSDHLFIHLDFKVLHGLSLNNFFIFAANVGWLFWNHWISSSAIKLFRTLSCWWSSFHSTKVWYSL